MKRAFLTIVCLLISGVCLAQEDAPVGAGYSIAYPETVSRIEYIKARFDGREVTVPVVNGYMPQFGTDGIIRYDRRIPFTQSKRADYKLNGYVQYGHYDRYYATNFTDGNYSGDVECHEGTTVRSRSNPNYRNRRAQPSYQDLYAPEQEERQEPEPKVEESKPDDDPLPTPAPLTAKQEVAATPVAAKKLTCPISGEEITDRSHKLKVGKKAIYFCCEDCRAAAIKQISDQGQVEVQTPEEKPETPQVPDQQTTASEPSSTKVCPMTGQPADEKYSLVVGDKTVSFCCEDCLKAAKESLQGTVSAWKPSGE